MSAQQANLDKPKTDPGCRSKACERGKHHICRSLRCGCTECRHGANGTIGTDRIWALNTLANQARKE